MRPRKKNFLSSRLCGYYAGYFVLAASLLVSTAFGGKPTVAPFPPDGEAQLIVADDWAYIVRGTPPVPVYSWQVSDVPRPPVPPDPPVPPVPPGEKLVVIVYERSNLLSYSRGQQRLIGSLTFRQRLEKAGHRLIAIKDKDTVDWAGNVPEELAPYFRACEGDPLPRIAIAPKSGGTVRDYPLPETEAAVFELLGGTP